MSQPANCPECGAAIPADQPKGLCPRCALSGLLKADGARASCGEAVAATGRIGGRFGDYELLEEIARGGMGVVFKARQKSLDRLVAVKLLLAGPHTSADFIKRFRLEASAAAALQHPNIVAIHEVGVHEGEHFLAMDYVDGPNLARLVREQPLLPKRAAAYVKTIAEAIHHAHEKGILHRDLKPSNVLIDSNDQPRVTDFGLAKRVGTESQPATDVSQLTLSGQVMGSPGYMPPEQASGQRGAMSRRSDVYSLGAMLYHLLTGRPPFGGGSAAETLRQVETQEPVSLRLLNPGVPLDLETICLKCLEKEPTHRYAMAKELAEELGRFVKDESINARPVGRPEKLWRWCRRQPALASLTAAVLMLLVAVAVVSSVFAVRLRGEVDAKERARGEAVAKGNEAIEKRQEAEAITRFITSAFQKPDPARDGRTITVAETLKQAVRQIDSDLTNQPSRRAALQLTLGGTYLALGLPRDAVPLQEAALDYYRAVRGPEHADTLHAMSELVHSYSKVGRRADALRLAEEVLAITRRVKGPEDSDTLLALHDVASAYDEIGRRAEALCLREEVLALRRKVNGPEHLHTLAAINNLAVSYSAARRLPEAIALREEVLALRRKVSGLKHPNTIGAMHGLAVSYSAAGRDADALALREQVLPLCLEVHGLEHRTTIKAMINLAVSYNKVGRRHEGLKLEEEALPLSRKVNGPEDPETLISMFNLAHSYFAVGRKAEALTLREESLALHRKVLTAKHPDTIEAMSQLAESYADTGRDAEARALREEIRALRRKPEDAPR